MKNLTSQGKKFLFRVGPHLLVIVIVLVVGYFSIIGNIDSVDAEKQKYIQYKHEQDSMLIIYQEKLDSMENTNFLLEQQLLGVDIKIDSMASEQNKLNKEYEKEINDLDNATISDHANWFYTKLDSIRQYYDRE